MQFYSSYYSDSKGKLNVTSLLLAISESGKRAKLCVHSIAC